MFHPEQYYLELLHYVRHNGVEKEDRTGVGTISQFGAQLRYDLQEGFPLLTTKKMFTRGIIHELLWFLKGETNIQYLLDNDVHIWDEWADENGDLGPIYGHQWRSWPNYVRKGGCIGNTDWIEEYHENEPIDQIKDLIENLKKDPFSRRHIVSAWNPADIPDMALAPCHCLFQFNVRPDKNGDPEFLDCQLYQRSCDIFLGVPFNIASYALFTMMIAQVVGLKAGHFIHTFGDVHVYKNHLDQVDEQLRRDPFPSPRMMINPDVKNIDDFTIGDFKVAGYRCHPKIDAPIAV